MVGMEARMLGEPRHEIGAGQAETKNGLRHDIKAGEVDLGGKIDAVQGDLGEVKEDMASVWHEMATSQAKLEGEINGLK